MGSTGKTKNLYVVNTNTWISCKSRKFSEIEFGSSNFIAKEERIRLPFSKKGIIIFIHKKNQHVLDKRFPAPGDADTNPMAREIFNILCDLFSPFENPLPVLRGIFGHMQIRFTKLNPFLKFKKKIQTLELQETQTLAPATPPPAAAPMGDPAMLGSHSTPANPFLSPPQKHYSREQSLPSSFSFEMSPFQLGESIVNAFTSDSFIKQQISTQ